MSYPSGSVSAWQKSCDNVVSWADYSIGSYRQGTQLNEKISRRARSIQSDRDRASSIRDTSPTRQFASLRGEYDPRPLYPSDPSSTDSVNSEFTRLMRRAQEDEMALKPLTDLRDHLDSLQRAVATHPSEILDTMGYSRNSAYPAMIGIPWLSPPKTQDLISRNGGLFFPTNSTHYHARPTRDNPRPAPQSIALRSVLFNVPFGYNSNGWVPMNPTMTEVPVALVERSGRNWLRYK